MKRKKNSKFALIASIVFLLAGFALGITQWLQYSSQPDVFPAGSKWGSFDVAGLSVTQAQDLIQATFDAPIALNYQGQTIQVDPNDLGYTLDDADPQAARQSPTGLAGFWSFLQGKRPSAVTLDLPTHLDDAVLTDYLKNQVAPHYDQPETEAVPIAGTTEFTPGQPGYQLNVDASAAVVKQALENGSRSVDLVVNSVPAGGVSPANLETFIRQQIQAAGFNGIAELYTRNLKTGEEVHFALQNNQEVDPGISFSAASTIKIPILVSIMRRTDMPVPDGINTLIEDMIIYSENPPADDLMNEVIGQNTAPLDVTSDMHALGLDDTFLAGYFYAGAPLLQVFQTQANSRTDINLDPDIYNQTTPADMVKLLTAIYNCADTGTGLLIDTFPGEITKEKCQYMLDMLKRNKIGVLTQAGVPEGTAVAHKHGWTEESDGYLHTLSDVAVVFAPDADYVFVLYLYDPIQLLFDPGNALFAQLSQLVYNADNLDHQAAWLFGPVTYR